MGEPSSPPATRPAAGRRNQIDIAWVVVAALVFVAVSARYYHGATGPFPAARDWVSFWIGSRTWSAGLDMYSDVDALAVWKRLAPPYPVYPMPQINPPYYPRLLWPALHWSLPVSIRVWALLSVLASGLFVLGLLHLYGRDWPVSWRCLFALLILVAGPVASGLYVGNAAMVVFAALVWSVAAMRAKRPVLVGVLWVIASLKWTILAPVILYALWRRDWRSVAAFVVLAGALLVASGPPRGVVANVRSMGARLQWLQAHSAPGDVRGNDPSPANTMQHEMVHAAVFWYDVLGDHPAMVSAVNGAIVLLTGALTIGVLLWRARSDELTWLSLLTTWGLLSVYHRGYDLAMLAWPAAYALTRLARREGQLARPDVRATAVALVGAVLFSWYVCHTRSLMGRVLHLLPGNPMRTLFLLGFLASWAILALHLYAVVTAPAPADDRAV